MGTAFVSVVKYPTRPTIHIPFEFSETDSYMLEFSGNRIRFIKNKQMVLSAGVPYEVVSPYADADLAELDYVQSGDVLYIVHKNHFPRTLARFSDTNWVLANAVIEDGPYRAVQNPDKNTVLTLSGYNYEVQVTSTTTNEFTSTDVTDGLWVEYYDDGFLTVGQIIGLINPVEISPGIMGSSTCRLNPSRKTVDFEGLDKSAVVTYYASPSPKLFSTVAIWSVESENAYIKVAGAWYLTGLHQSYPESSGGASNDIMLVSSGPLLMKTTGTVALTSKTRTASLKSSSNLFVAADVGRHFRLTLGDRNIWGIITAAVIPKLATVSLREDLPNDPWDSTRYLRGGQTNNWRLGAWYTGNYPSVVGIHQQRLIFGGTPLEPNRLAMSMTDDFVSFATANKFGEVLDTSGINFSVGVGQINKINWIQSGPVLLIGTQGDEFQLKASSLSEALTPTNFNLSQQTPYGSRRYLKPIKIGIATLFVQQHGISIRELVYNFEVDSFIASDLTIIAEDIIRRNGTVVAMCYQQIPNSIIWVACSNGKLLSFTYEKEHQVFAWAEHEIAGGLVKWVSRIPSSSDNKDQIYLVVERVISGVTTKYNEVFVPDFQPASPTTKTGMIYLDSSITYSGAATTNITGLSHLEGKEVSIVADGSSVTKKTVTGGAITLDTAASLVYVGLGYSSYIKTLGMEGGSQIGTALAKIKKIIRVDVQLYATIGLKYGTKDPSNNPPISFMETMPVLGRSPDLFTGFVELKSDSGFGVDNSFYIVQDQPYPCTILALMPVVTVNE